jgi:lysophospholipase L1-like esterase
MLRFPLAKLGLALAGALCVLLLAELAVRLFGLGPEFQVVHRRVFQLSDNPLLEYELRPGAPDGDGRINSAGFRDREFAREKPPGVFRIVVIGDSVTFGHPDFSRESYTKHLERLLNAASGGLAFEVLNLGVIGYDVTRSAERLRLLGLPHQPDLILYGYVLNDPQETSVEGLALLERREAAEQRFLERVERGSLRWLSGSRLFLLAQQRLRSRGRAEPPPAVPLPVDPAWQAVASGDSRGEYFRALHRDPVSGERLLAGLERIAGLGRGAGVPLVLAIFPLFLEREGGAYALSDVHAFVAREARQRGMDVLDLEPAFAAAEANGLDCSADFVHPNELGNAIAAEALLEGLPE